MNKKVLMLIMLIMLIILIILLQYKYNPNPIIIKDKFTVLDPQAIIKNDGKMKFDYITDPYYGQKILKKYYIDYDKKINGRKVNDNPYKYPSPNCANAAEDEPLIFSANPSLHCRRGGGKMPKWWNKYDTEAQEIYNQYSIYR